MESVNLTPEQEIQLKNSIKVGIYIELMKQGLLTDEQLQLLTQGIISERP